MSIMPYPFTESCLHLTDVFYFCSSDVNEPFQLEMTVTGNPVPTKFGTMAGLTNGQTINLGQLNMSFCLEPMGKSVRTYKLGQPASEDSGNCSVKSDCEVVVMIGLHILEEPIEDRSWETEALYQGFLTLMTRGGRMGVRLYSFQFYKMTEYRSVN